MAVGAGRGRMVRQMLTESLLISLLGGAAGLALAYAVRNGIPRLLSNAWLPPAFAARFDWRIFFFAVSISLATGLIFGLAPAWAATCVRVSSALKDSASKRLPTAARAGRQNAGGAAGGTLDVAGGGSGTVHADADGPGTREARIPAGQICSLSISFRRRRAIPTLQPRRFSCNWKKSWPAFPEWSRKRWCRTR